MTDSPYLDDVLQLADQSVPVDEISRRVGTSLGYVYRLLRRHRPDRPRKPRRCSSDVPAKVLGLAGRGMKPPRIAVVLGVSRAYVYRILGTLT